MLSKQWMVLLLTAIAPCVWGTTYLVTSELLPPDRPLLAAALRSLPAGALLVILVRRLPTGSWWWRAGVLGMLNIGVFFALLFIAAYRLPGGVAATIGAVQPLLVAVLAAGWIGEKLTPAKLTAGMTGLIGVAMLVLQAQARLDLVGVIAALSGAVAMASGVVLTKKWGRPDTLLAITSWQLVAGGLFLAPIAFLVEGPPPQALTLPNIAGYLYLGIIGTAVAYTLWFRGVHLLPASTTAILGLLSPLVATLAGWALLDQTLTSGQLIGAIIILGTLVLSTIRPLQRMTPGPSPAAHRTNPKAQNPR